MKYFINLTNYSQQERLEMTRAVIEDENEVLFVEHLDSRDYILLYRNGEWELNYLLHKEKFFDDAEEIDIVKFRELNLMKPTATDLTQEEMQFLTDELRRTYYKCLDGEVHIVRSIIKKLNLIELEEEINATL